MSNPSSVSLVRAYESALVEALGEYTLQFILSGVGYARDMAPWDDGIERKRIKNTFDVESAIALDSGYYRMGNLFFARSGNLWEELQHDSFGRLFTLSNEELIEGLKRF